MFRGAMKPMPNSRPVPAATDPATVSDLMLLMLLRCFGASPSLGAKPASCAVPAQHARGRHDGREVRELRLRYCPNGQEVRRITDPREIGVKMNPAIVKMVIPITVPPVGGSLQVLTGSTVTSLAVVSGPGSVPPSRLSGSHSSPGLSERSGANLTAQQPLPPSLAVHSIRIDYCVLVKVHVTCSP